jgi:membrane protein DedA with SNARE-associated domain/rhodanese-related sulfurtransferase
MPFALDFFIHHAYLVLFLWVLAEQMGAPLPSIPLLLTAGTLTATHRLHLPLVIASVLAGSLISDTAWYFLGKRYGGAVVRLLCRLSMETTTCVRKTEDYFAKKGPASLLGTVAAPIAGETGMKLRIFLLWDTAGILIWALAGTLSGRFFGDILKRHPEALSWVAHFAVALFFVLVVAFVVARFVRQRLFLKELRMARIFPDELKERLDRGQEVVIVDLRHPLDYLPDPRTLPGALRLTPDKLMEQIGQIPRDREVVLFCTCPSEQTAASTALKLRKAGIQKVRPLYGGFDEWKKRGYPLVPYSGDLVQVTVAR